MNKISETDRLILREFELSDAKSMFELNADPEVIKYTGDDPFESVTAAEDFLRKYDQYKKNGFGRWAVILKETGEFIGWCGLNYISDWDEHDVGFRFFKKHWGQGYATEAATNCIELAFDKYDIQKLVGRSVKQNEASIHVLKKLGFSFKKEMDFHGMEGIVFEKTL